MLTILIARDKEDSQGNSSLAQQYPTLYNITHRKQVSVAHVLEQENPNIQFRRALTGNRWFSWLHLASRLMDVHLTDNKDSFGWGLTNSGIFTVKSMYLDFMNGHTKYLFKYIWKMKVPLKIRIFMWFLHRFDN